MLNGNRLKSHRARSPRDLYITPLSLANAAIRMLGLDEGGSFYAKHVLDAGCGTGVWGKAVANHIFTDNIYGIDLKPCIDKENSSYYEEIIEGDYLQYKPSISRYHLICGNPPYSLAENFLRHSFEILEPYGYVYFLLRLSFLEGIKRGKGLFSEFPLKRVYVCSRRPSFFSSDDEHHTTDTLAYAMFLWQYGYTKRPVVDFLDWDYE